MVEKPIYCGLLNFIKIDDLNRHPSQIYEAIFEGLILFILMKML